MNSYGVNETLCTDPLLPDAGPYTSDDSYLDQTYSVPELQEADDHRVAGPAEDQQTYLLVPSDDKNTTSQKLVAAGTKRKIKRTTCPECGRNILQRVFDRHMRTVHGHGQVYTCNECGLDFPRKDSLDRHVREQHGDETDLVECMRCGAEVGKRSLNEHFHSQKCRESLDTSRNNRASERLYTIDVKDPGSALIRCARFLVTIRTEVQAYVNSNPESSPKLLEIRHEALQTLGKAVSSGTIDVDLLCAIWTFGLADLILDGEAEAHRAALTKLHSQFYEWRSGIESELERVFRHCTDSQAAEQPETSHMVESDVFVPGCHRIIALAGFPGNTEEQEWLEELCQWLVTYDEAPPRLPHPYSKTLPRELRISVPLGRQRLDHWSRHIVWRHVT